MSFYSLARICVAVSASGLLVACTAFYPRFDNPLNPDILYIGAGEVVDSVKCSINSYFLERASEIEANASYLLEHQLKSNRANIIDPHRYCDLPDGWNKNNWKNVPWQIRYKQAVTDISKPSGYRCELSGTNLDQ